MARYEKQITARDDTQSIPSAQRRTAYLADLFHYLADAREIRYISSALGSVALACAERARDAAREEEKKRRIILPRERERERGGGEGWDVSLALCCYAREIIPPEARGVSDSRSLNVLMHSSFCSPLRNTLCFYVRRCSSRAEIYSSAHPPIGWLTSDPQFLSVTEKHPLSLLIS
jgi:hypothetical protein